MQFEVTVESTITHPVVLGSAWEAASWTSRNRTPASSAAVMKPCCRSVDTERIDDDTTLELQPGAGLKRVFRNGCNTWSEQHG